MILLDSIIDVRCSIECYATVTHPGIRCSPKSNPLGPTTPQKASAAFPSLRIPPVSDDQRHQTILQLSADSWRSKGIRHLATNPSIKLDQGLRPQGEVQCVQALCFNNLALDSIDFCHSLRVEFRDVILEMMPLVVVRSKDAEGESTPLESDIQPRAVSTREFCCN